MTTTKRTMDAYDRPSSVEYHAYTVELFTRWCASPSQTLQQRRWLRRRCRAIAKTVDESVDTVWRWFAAEGLANHENISIEDARAIVEDA